MQSSIILLVSVSIFSIISSLITWSILKRLYVKNLDNSLEHLQTLHRIDMVQLQERNYSLEHSHNTLQEQLSEKYNEVNNLRNLIQEQNAKLATTTEQIQNILPLKQEKKQLEEKVYILMQEKQKLAANIAHLSTKLEAEQLQNAEKLSVLQEAKEQLTHTFKTLSQEILEEKSKRFTEQNQSNLSQLIEPLKVQIQDFKGKVEQAYDIEGKERSALAEQVKAMMVLNQQLSKDANNLAKALKGDNKFQGNWGELILEKVLEMGGLRKDYEYTTQERHKIDGVRIQPDVIVHLPAKRHIIIDAKASITAYSEYSQAEHELGKDLALKKHIESIKNHIKNLADKNYQNIYDDKSPDFILMFIPLEPAFMLAIANDNNLWHQAWEKNILLVSPSTLLFVIRMVSQIWRNEYQSQNTKDIVKRGAELYDKLVGFVEDIQKIGECLTKAQDSYAKAYNKFKDGRGNVIRQAEMLKELGIKPSKNLPMDIIDSAMNIEIE